LFRLRVFTGIFGADQGADMAFPTLPAMPCKVRKQACAALKNLTAPFRKSGTLC
jgi:hypothetical protein